MRRQSLGVGTKIHCCGVVRSRWRWLVRRGGGSEAHLIRARLRLILQSGLSCGSVPKSKRRKGEHDFAKRLLRAVLRSSVYHRVGG
ncbi:MAG: hypothetical protein CM15mP74_16330 [Halieaceae bacterium]|nr:MAG: hypothetical protein CM15mP74_16330 [Halieaceae bacterium]